MNNQRHRPDFVVESQVVLGLPYEPKGGDDSELFLHKIVSGKDKQELFLHIACTLWQPVYSEWRGASKPYRSRKATIEKRCSSVSSSRHLAQRLSMLVENLAALTPEATACLIRCHAKALYLGCKVLCFHTVFSKSKI